MIERNGGSMEDMISRKAAIDALKHNQDVYSHNFHDDPIDKYTTAIIATDIDTLVKLPSAQLETHDKRTETHACDLIDRQAAIDAILAVTGNSSVRELYEHVQEHELSDMWSGGVNAAIDIIIAVPSAQPEMIREIRKWINSGNRGNADYFIVEKIEEIINKYE